MLPSSLKTLKCGELTESCLLEHQASCSSTGHVTSPTGEDLAAGSSQTCTPPVSRPLVSFSMVAEKELAVIRKDYPNPAGRKCIVSDYNGIKRWSKQREQRFQFIPI